MKKNIQFTLFTIIIGVILFSVPAFAREARDVQVHFEPGSSATTIKETIIGYQTINYKLRARAGQSMLVNLASSNESNYFNIYAPGKGPGDEAIFIGSMRGSRYDELLAMDGEYTVQVFLMRNAARRNEKGDYTLTIQIDGATKDNSQDGNKKSSQ